MSGQKFKDTASTVFHAVFSKTTLVIILVVFYAFMFVLGIVLTVQAEIERNRELTISDGIIVDKYDIAGGRTDKYYLIYENENADGETIQRKDRVTAVTYSEYDIGDYYVAKATVYGSDN